MLTAIAFPHEEEVEVGKARAEEAERIDRILLALDRMQVGHYHRRASAGRHGELFCEALLSSLVEAREVDAVFDHPDLPAIDPLLLDELPLDRPGVHPDPIRHPAGEAERRPAPGPMPVGQVEAAQNELHAG